MSPDRLLLGSSSPSTIVFTLDESIDSVMTSSFEESELEKNPSLIVATLDAKVSASTKSTSSMIEESLATCVEAKSAVASERIFSR